jgi:hypothetical protein
VPQGICLIRLADYGGGVGVALSYYSGSQKQSNGARVLFVVDRVEKGVVGKGIGLFNK